MPRKTARKLPKSRQRSTRAKKTRQAKLKRAFQAGSIFLISLIFLSGFMINKYLNQNFASALSTTSYTTLDDSIPTIAYIVAKDMNSDSLEMVKLEYLIFDKNAKKVLTYSIPLTLELDIPGDFGNAELSKVFLISALNSEDTFDSGMSLTRDVLLKLFGFKVDRFLVTSTSLAAGFDEYFSEGKYVDFMDVNNILEMKKLIKSDMSFKEFKELGTFIRSLPSERVVRKDFSIRALEDTSEIDDEIMDITLESNVAAERLPVAVLNGTSYQGFASFGARVVTNLGGRVVAVNNSDISYDTGYVIAEDVTSSTANVLARTFGIEKVMSKDEAFRFSDNEMDRADVVLILGLDTAQRLY